MLIAPIQKDPLPVLARMDIVEMVQHVMVSVCFELIRTVTDLCFACICINVFHNNVFSYTYCC
jgi:hypothetical protein